MITNRDIEIAFVRAQIRINEQIENAQAEFYKSELSDMADMLIKQLGSSKKNSNPLANEEI